MELVFAELILQHAGDVCMLQHGTLIGQWRTLSFAWICPDKKCDINIIIRCVNTLLDSGEQWGAALIAQDSLYPVMLGPAPTSLNVHSVVTLHYNALCQDTHLICASFSDKSLNTCYGHSYLQTCHMSSWPGLHQTCMPCLLIFIIDNKE